MWKLIFVAIIGAILVCYIEFYYNRLKNNYLILSFKGKVEKVYYDKKGEPKITVNNIVYDLPVNLWDFNHKIQKGDFIEKSANNFRIKLTKNPTGEIIYFK